MAKSIGTGYVIVSGSYSSNSIVVWGYSRDFDKAMAYAKELEEEYPPEDEYDDSIFDVQPVNEI